MIKGNEERMLFKMADKLGVTLSNLKAALKSAEAEVEAEDNRSSAPIAEDQTTSDKFDNHDPDLHSHGNEADDDKKDDADSDDEYQGN